MTSPADTFRALHQGPEILVLPNAWDAGSARLMQTLGAKAVATTSAGVAWSHGYPDGDALPLEALVSTVRTMRRVLTVPLSVDVEGGYSADPDHAAANVAAVVAAGAVGINIEDGAAPSELLCAKLARIRASVGPGLFINVRTDVYLRGLADNRVAAVLARAEAYRAAGADGLFVPGLSTPEDIRAVVAACDLPLNVMAVPGLPPADALQALGVRRLSAGSAIIQTLWAEAWGLSGEFLRLGRADLVAGTAMPYGEINGLFTR